MDVAVYYRSLGDRQFLLLWRQEELCYHPKGTDKIDNAQPIDDFLALSYRELLAPMAEPQMKPQIMAGEQMVSFPCHSLIVYRFEYPCSHAQENAPSGSPADCCPSGRSSAACRS